MTAAYDSLANPMTHTDAREALDDLMAWVGVDGMVAALRVPGLLAEVDQHAAAVRDAIAASDQEVDALTLNRYARSVVAAATRMGRPLPEPTPGGTAETLWDCADWHLVRLVAVCAVAVEVDAL
jgi:hypothetical protein